jgi:hypothetical protein
LSERHVVFIGSFTNHLLAGANKECIRWVFKLWREMAQQRGEAQLTAPHRYYRHGVGTTDGGRFWVKNFESR